MTRIGVLRAGYGALGFAFAGLAAGIAVPSLVIPGLALGLVAGALLAFSDDPLPKWSGIALVVYFVVTVVAFLAATGITVELGGERYFVNDSPAAATQSITSWITLASPLMLAGAGTVAVWERERPPRILLLGAIAGFVIVGILTAVLVPELDPKCATDAFAPGCAGAAQQAAAEGARQGNMLRMLTAVSAAAGAAGAIWAAGRPDEYA